MGQSLTRFYYGERRRGRELGFLSVGGWRIGRGKVSYNGGRYVLH